MEVAGCLAADVTRVAAAELLPAFVECLKSDEIMGNFDLLRFEVIDLTELVDDSASLNADRQPSSRKTGCSIFGGRCHGSSCGCKKFMGSCGSKTA